MSPEASLRRYRRVRFAFLAARLAGLAAFAVLLVYILGART